MGLTTRARTKTSTAPAPALLRVRDAASTVAPLAMTMIGDWMLETGESIEAIIESAGLSLVASVGLFFSGDHEKGIFVGLWVPSILSGGALLMGRDDHD